MTKLLREFMVDYNAKQVFNGVQSDYMQYKNIERIISSGGKRYSNTKSPKKAAFVYEENNKLLGYICGEIKTDTEKTVFPIGYIDDWFVSKKYRGKKIGKQLWDQMIVFFKEHHVKIIRLEVFNQNKSAYKLYEKMGFKPLETVLLKHLK